LLLIVNSSGTKHGSAHEADAFAVGSDFRIGHAIEQVRDADKAADGEVRSDLTRDCWSGFECPGMGVACNVVHTTHDSDFSVEGHDVRAY